MLKVQSFTFNPFSENTYLVWDINTLECAIFDPGCSDNYEQNILEEFIASNKLFLVYMINTHCHIDHVFGNHHFFSKYDLELHAHKFEEPVLQSAEETSILYGFNYIKSPEIKHFIDENSTIKIGNTELEIRFTPGHSPGSLTFINHNEKWALVGDVIFNGSIGRTDLPGGDFDTLINSIKEQIYTLPDDYILLSGHGTETNVGQEKRSNPFVRG